MAKLGSGMADKLKNLARGIKDEENSQGSVKKLGDKIRQSETRKKQSASDGKLSGRKD